MKNLINKILFLVTILTISISVFPQSRKIEQKTVVKSQKFQDLFEGLSNDDVTIKFNGYYNDDDEFVYHGPVTSNHSVTYKGDGYWMAKGAAITITYTVKGNYVDGNLNGPLTISKFYKATYQGATLTCKYDLSANYAKGIPNGKWTVVGSESGSLNGQRGKENYNLVATYKNGKITSYDNGKGEKFTFNEDGTFSGNYNDDVYKNSINTSNFIRKTGETTKLSDEAKILVDGLVNGNLKDSVLFKKGYIQNVLETDFLGKMNICFYWMDFFDIYIYDSNFASSLEQHYRDKNYTTNLKTLKRVDFLSWEEIKSHLDVINFNKFDFVQNYYYSYSDGVTIYINLGHNKIEVNSQVYYYDNEVKEKIVSFLNEEQLKKIQAEEEQRKREEEERLAKIKENVSGALNKLVKVSNVKEMKFWGVDVVLGADFTSNPQDWSNFSVTKELLVERLSPFCPILNYEILDMENINENLIVKCNLNKFIGKKAGYETYQTEIFVDTYGKVDMSKSFNFKQAVKVENDWDKIRSLNSQIDANKAKITGEKDKFLSDVVSAYTKYHKSYNFEVGDNTGDCVSRLESFVKIQNQCFEFIELRKKINANDVAILGNGTTNKNVVKLYVSYFKTLDLVWSSDEKAKDKLNDVIATQDRLIQILSSEYASLLEVAVVEEKIVNLQSVFDCFETIDLRKQRNENNDAIMAQAKQCKNIVKIYAAYFKKLDFTWVSADASKVKFEEVIANQNIIRKALESSNAAELDTAVKKEKIKDIQILVNRLK